MGNPANAFDFDDSLATFLASVISDGTYGSLLTTLKFDETGNEADASDIAAAGGQLWSNVMDDFVRATYPSFHLATKVWRVVDETTLLTLGSDNSLAVDDIGYTEDENRLWYCTAVTGVNTSTWSALPIRVPFSQDQVSSEVFGVASVNDYTPPSPWPAVHVLRLTPNAANTTLTGLDAGEDGHTVRVCNISTVDNLILSHDDGASAAANRILGSNGGNVTIRPTACISLWYDIISTRWRSG